MARILGESEIYLDAGSTINITCVVKHTPVPPSHVQWEHQGKVSADIYHNQNKILENTMTIRHYQHKLSEIDFFVCSMNLKYKVKIDFDEFTFLC